MQFEDIIGQNSVKRFLEQSIDRGRIPNTFLFVGPEGSGALPIAIAYAAKLLALNHSQPEVVFQNVSRLSHPDLYFIFPTFTNDKIKSKPKSIDFISEWREFQSLNPYGGLFDWYQFLGSDTKQGEIRVEDAHEVSKFFSLKSYEGGFRVLIIWMADKMNNTVSNRLLKTLEEPSEKTVVILIAENEEDLLQTIRSRCQAVYLRGLGSNEITDALVSRFNLDSNKAQQITHQAQGNYNKALKLIREENDNLFEMWFVTWVRSAFKAKNNAAAIHDLLNLSEEIARLGREVQKKFIKYCLEMFRQALLMNYQVSSLVYIETTYQNFKLENFAPFINGKNILDIFKELSEALYLIERNGNAKIVLADLSIKLTRQIHKK